MMSYTNHYIIIMVAMTTNFCGSDSMISHTIKPLSPRQKLMGFSRSPHTDGSKPLEVSEWTSSAGAGASVFTCTLTRPRHLPGERLFEQNLIALHCWSSLRMPDDAR